MTGEKNLKPLEMPYLFLKREERRTPEATGQSFLPLYLMVQKTKEILLEVLSRHMDDR